MHKKHYKSIITLCILGLVVTSVVYAAFTFKGKVLGSKFSVASSEIQILKDVRNGTTGENLASEVDGPDFANITPNWTKDYLLKIYNNGTANVQITSNANYATANDPDELRSYIYVEPFFWNDTNNNGELDSEELGEGMGKKTIVKWKTEGYSFGSINTGEVASFVLRFTTEALSESKQGKAGVFDFEFDSISL